MSKIIFSEEQKYRTPWIWLVIFPAIGVLIFLLKLNELKSDFANPVGEDGLSGLIILEGFLFVFMVGLTILFYKMKLITQIKLDGIHFRYPPFINKERIISKANIRKYEVRKYNPNREFKGHGVKKGKRFKKTGLAYTVSGRIGLQLFLKNGDKILIGTKRKEAIKYAMDKLMKTIEN